MTLDHGTAPALATLAADVSLRDAAHLYTVSTSTLARRLRLGELRGYKVRGPWGHEWRVDRDELEATGYGRRPAPELGTTADPRLVPLRRELASLRRIVAAERLRADRADQELGFVMLECGRLRGALARSGSSPTPSSHAAHETAPCTVRSRADGAISA